MASFCWPYFDPEYETLNHRIHPPRVSIDNNACQEHSVVTVDSVNKPGILLEVVQVLTELDLVIGKAYICSDGRWFMDVFHVTDQQGNKLTSSKTIEQIEKALGANGNGCPKAVGLQTLPDEYTVIELMGSDKPGLLSEISAVLAQNHCNVVAAEVWTHNTRVACVVYITDSQNSGRVDDPTRLKDIKDRLQHVLLCRGGHSWIETSTDLTHAADRRLHKMMSLDPDSNCDPVLLRNLQLCDSGGFPERVESPAGPRITVETCKDKGYSVINVKCKDRPKLLFDTVCALTDMNFVVFHASVVLDGPNAIQEFYVRRQMDDCALATETEKQSLIKSLESAILRRVTHGVSLELSARDRVGLLSDVTRVLRENGLTVMRAGVSTTEGKAVNVFYVQDTSGKPVDMKTIETLRKDMGQSVVVSKLDVKKAPIDPQKKQVAATTRFSFSLGRLIEKLLY